ncbi:MAG: VWA domain-containing protein [Pirellulaceae bacterium]|nr:VWA domain-containing protein [Pirellulaceae bacterium]
MMLAAIIQDACLGSFNLSSLSLGSFTLGTPVLDTLILGQAAAPTTGIEQVLDRAWPWSIWFTLLCGLLVALVVSALYATERGRASQGRRALLAGLRVAALLLVVWMLAGWSIQRFKSDMPELVILIDDSASMQTSDGASVTSTGRQPRQSRWETAKQILIKTWSSDDELASRRYRPKLYAIAEEARQLATSSEELTAALAQVEPKGQHSRIGDGLIQVMQRQSGRPTAAVVLFSDGIVTSGSPLEDAVASARRLGIPVYCVATGEQLPQPDLALVDLLADDAVYLGDRVNVQVSVAASDVAAHRTTVNLRDMQSGQVVDAAQVELSSARNTTTVQLSFVPKVAGSSVIKLEIAAAPGEKNLDNNVLDRVIDVRDQTLRVLMVQRSPSFEYRFLKTLLERTSNLADPDKRAFELDVVLQDADASHVAQDSHALRLVPGDLETIASYDVVIIGQLDPALVAGSTQQMIVDQVTTAGCGCMFVCHPDFQPSQLLGWPLGKLLPLELSGSGQVSNVSGGIADSTGPGVWKYDGTSRRWQPTMLGQSALPLQLVDAGSADSLWRTLPGPDWHFVPGPLKAGAQVLATAVSEQASANANMASAPLLISQFTGAGRVVMQTTDETYRWIGYRGNELMYERYWIQMLRWLSRGKLNRQDQSELAVEPRRAQLGEAVQFTVRLGANVAAGLDVAQCQVTVERIGGDVKQVQLNRTQAATAEFKASDAGLAAGSYRATLSRPQDATLGSVTFTVTAPPGEQANLRSDWRAMQTLADQTHGKFFTAAKADSLLRQLPTGTPVRRGALPPVPLWNTPWVALAFVLIVTLEWILRRLSNML